MAVEVMGNGDENDMGHCKRRSTKIYVIDTHVVARLADVMLALHPQWRMIPTCSGPCGRGGKPADGSQDQVVMPPLVLMDIYTWAYLSKEPPDPP